jgi:hypothetical protein
VDEYCWRDVSDIPTLLFDHQEIIETALLTLRGQIYQQPIGYNLLPEKFTLPEIHALYETILGRPVDRRNFRKKLLTLGLIRQLAELKKSARTGRPSSMNSTRKLIIRPWRKAPL